MPPELFGSKLAEFAFVDKFQTFQLFDVSRVIERGRLCERYSTVFFEKFCHELRAEIMMLALERYPEKAGDGSQIVIAVAFFVEVHSLEFLCDVFIGLFGDFYLENCTWGIRAEAQKSCFGAFLNEACGDRQCGIYACKAVKRVAAGVKADRSVCVVGLGKKGYHS